MRNMRNALRRLQQIGAGRHATTAPGHPRRPGGGSGGMQSSGGDGTSGATITQMDATGVPLATAKPASKASDGDDGVDEDPSTPPGTASPLRRLRHKAVSL